MTGRDRFLADVDGELAAIRTSGRWKPERVLTSAQDGRVHVESVGEVLNLCANNYLGLADHPALTAAATRTMNTDGYGMASVRFICGTNAHHRELEADLAAFLGTEDAITFAACFDANGAVFEPLFGPDDHIVSDQLNHASIIDGIRLCRANRHRFRSGDLDELERTLQEIRATSSAHVLIATDAVFSMDGVVADLVGICDLADRFDALVMVDDCHGTGVLGPAGAGTPAHQGVAHRIDILTTTLGKALGGGMGGVVAARRPIVELLRQRARPYLFSNALAPGLVAGARAALVQTAQGDERRRRLHRNAERFRRAMVTKGFELAGRGHPIVPVMVRDDHLAGALADALLDRGVLVSAFSFPVVPEGTARIRTQMTAAHTEADIDVAVDAFVEAADAVGWAR